MSNVGQQAGNLGKQADDSDWLDRAVRLGLVTYGIVHLMIAWLALQLALGDQSGSASSTGALKQLAQESYGVVLIWMIAVGMFLLVVWRLIETFAGFREEQDDGKRLRKRLTSLGKAVIYGTLCLSAVKIAVGAGSGGSSSDTVTAKVMDWPGGQFIVGAVGLAIIGYGANLVRRAWNEKFREHLSAEGTSGEVGRAYVMFGKAGYTAKGVAFMVVGGLFGYAAITHEAKKSGGLDQALHKVLQQPFGPFLLGAIAIGIACYGLFCFARARHLSR
ncbi:DUF1206 domain-containing protein [Nocardioides sp.]|uniref:DUF1206 domain-containing protein n=1 Tax=Nocardioides sp. TaxID=35761 RepID=UPI003D0BD6ED